MPPLIESTSGEEDARHNNAISLVQQKTCIPVPRIYALEVKGDCSVKAPFERKFK